MQRRRVCSALHSASPPTHREGGEPRSFRAHPDDRWRRDGPLVARGGVLPSNRTAPHALDGAQTPKAVGAAHAGLPRLAVLCDELLGDATRRRGAVLRLLRTHAATQGGDAHARVRPRSSARGTRVEHGLPDIFGADRLRVGEHASAATVGGSTVVRRCPPGDRSNMPQRTPPGQGSTVNVRASALKLSLLRQVVSAAALIVGKSTTFVLTHSRSGNTARFGRSFRACGSSLLNVQTLATKQPDAVLLASA
jgi:hypothetical protein